jgi:hypothetical protein
MLDKFITAITANIVNPLVILLFAIALVVFLWGVLVFVANAGDADALTTAKRHVMYGVLGMAIMMAAFSLVHVITGALGIDTSKNLDTIQKN